MKKKKKKMYQYNLLHIKHKMFYAIFRRSLSSPSTSSSSKAEQFIPLHTDVLELEKKKIHLEIEKLEMEKRKTENGNRKTFR